MQKPAQPTSFHGTPFFTLLGLAAPLRETGPLWLSHRRSPASSEQSCVSWHFPSSPCGSDDFSLRSTVRCFNAFTHILFTPAFAPGWPRPLHSSPHSWSLYRDHPLTAWPYLKSYFALCPYPWHTSCYLLEHGRPHNVQTQPRHILCQAGGNPVTKISYGLPLPSRRSSKYSADQAVLHKVRPLC